MIRLYVNEPKNVNKFSPIGTGGSEDERKWREELTKPRKEARINEEKQATSIPKFYELKSGENFKTIKSTKDVLTSKQKK